MNYFYEDRQSETGWAIKVLVFEVEQLVDAAVAVECLRLGSELIIAYDKEHNIGFYQIELQVCQGQRISERSL